MANADVIVDTLLGFIEDLEIGTPPLRWAMPDVNFATQTDADGALVPYLEVGFFPNDPLWNGLADGALDQGLLSITVVMPPRQGIIAPTQFVTAIKAAFSNGSRPGGVVKVTKAPWHSSAIYLAAETRVPVTIPWTA